VCSIGYGFGVAYDLRQVSSMSYYCLHSLCLDKSKIHFRQKAAQQSVHLTLGILRTSQAFFYALAFFQLDGFAVPTPAQVTHTVGRHVQKTFIQ